MNLQELIQLLLAKVSYLIKKHDKDETAHDLENKLRQNIQILSVYSSDLVDYAYQRGMLDTYTVGSGTKEQFYNDIQNYLINNWGISASDYDFEIFISSVASEETSIPNNICLIYYYDNLWDNKETVYIYDYTKSIMKKIGTNTKTLTITYTDETTEDIEFYIR